MGDTEAHDHKCEAEYVVGATGYTDCGCSDRMGGEMIEPVTRVMTNPVYVLRGGVYLQDEYCGVLIDSSGNYSAKTRGDPRGLAVLLRAIAEDIDMDLESS